MAFFWVLPYYKDQRAVIFQKEITILFFGLWIGSLLLEMLKLKAWLLSNAKLCLGISVLGPILVFLCLLPGMILFETHGVRLTALMFPMGEAEQITSLQTIQFVCIGILGAWLSIWWTAQTNKKNSIALLVIVIVTFLFYRFAITYIPMLDHMFYYSPTCILFVEYFSIGWMLYHGYKLIQHKNHEGKHTFLD